MVRLHITFLHFTARNRCGAYNPVTPDISFWLVRTQTTVLKIVTLLAKSTPDFFKLTWIGPYNAVMPQATTGCTSSSCSKIRHVIANFIHAITTLPKHRFESHKYVNMHALLYM